MTVRIDREGPIATVVMDRPEALNAFTAQQLERLIDAFRDIGDDGSVRVVILTGAGERAFAAGADIKAMASMSEEEGLAFGRLGHAASRSVEELPQPVIAAVNGFALGGGCEIALAADLRIASERAVFGQPEVGLGIPPGWGATQRLPRLVGPGIAAEMIFTGRQVKAEEALRIGLVNRVFPPADLMQSARDVALEVASKSPAAVRAAKQALRLAFNEQTISGLETECRLFGAAFGTADQREGMTAFLERRSAAFQDV